MNLKLFSLDAAHTVTILFHEANAFSFDSISSRDIINRMMKTSQLQEGPKEISQENVFV